MNETICVIMSTYNGTKYLKSQIDSILQQKGVNISLIVRDDGSTDNTIKILEDYKKKSKLNYYVGTNKGSAYSFWDTLLKAEDCLYYAFADQDDYWLEDKLCSAVRIVKENDTVPFLYFSKKTIVDSDLKKLPVEDEIVRETTLAFSLLKGFASGCTMVFNKKLYQALTRYTPEVMTMHDAWILKVAGAIGKVYYDDHSYILYRQHGDNVVGNQTRWKLLKRHMSKLFSYKDNDITSKMAKQLVTVYGNQMQKEDLRNSIYLSDIRKSLTARRKLFFSNYFKTQIPYDIILFKVFFILGWL